MYWIQLNSIELYALLKHRPEEGQIPEMIHVCDYDILIVLGELNTLI